MHMHFTAMYSNISIYTLYMYISTRASAHVAGALHACTRSAGGQEPVQCGTASEPDGYGAGAHEL